MVRHYYSTPVGWDNSKYSATVNGAFIEMSRGVIVL